MRVRALCRIAISEIKAISGKETVWSSSISFIVLGIAISTTLYFALSKITLFARSAALNRTVEKNIRARALQGKVLSFFKVSIDMERQISKLTILSHLNYTTLNLKYFSGF